MQMHLNYEQRWRWTYIIKLEMYFCGPRDHKSYRWIWTRFWLCHMRLWCSTSIVNDLALQNWSVKITGQLQASWIVLCCLQDEVHSWFAYKSRPSTISFRIPSLFVCHYHAHSSQTHLVTPPTFMPCQVLSSKASFPCSPLLQECLSIHSPIRLNPTKKELPQIISWWNPSLK